MKHQNKNFNIYFKFLKFNQNITKIIYNYIKYDIIEYKHITENNSDIIIISLKEIPKDEETNSLKIYRKYYYLVRTNIKGKIIQFFFPSNINFIK